MKIACKTNFRFNECVTASHTIIGANESENGLQVLNQPHTKHTLPHVFRLNKQDIYQWNVGDE